MISKSQLVIFSALLASQGLVDGMFNEMTASAPASDAKFVPAADSKASRWIKRNKFPALFKAAEDAKKAVAGPNAAFQNLKKIYDEKKAAAAAAQAEITLTKVEKARSEVGKASIAYKALKAKLAVMSDEIPVDESVKTAEADVKAADEAVAGLKGKSLPLKALKNWSAEAKMGTYKQSLFTDSAMRKAFLAKRQKWLDLKEEQLEEAVVALKAAEQYPKALVHTDPAEVKRLQAEADKAKAEAAAAKKELDQAEADLKKVVDASDAADKALDQAVDAKAQAEAAAKADADKQKAETAAKADADKKEAETAAKADADKKEAENAAEKGKTEQSQVVAPTPVSKKPATYMVHTAADAEKIAEAQSKVITASDNTKAAEVKKFLINSLMLAERLDKAEKKHAPKKTDAAPAERNLRRLAEKNEAAEKPVDHYGDVILKNLKDARESLGALQANYGEKFERVQDMATFGKFKTAATETEAAIARAEAVIKLRDDNNSKAAELKSAKATVLGLGLGLGLGIPVLVGVVFTVLVKTNRVLLNFGSTVSADV